MKMDIQLDKVVQKTIDASDKKIQKAFLNRVKIFKNDPSHPVLRNHALKGKFLGLRSINITGDWRALFVEYKGSKENIVIIFRFLGTHSQLYKE